MYIIYTGCNMYGQIINAECVTVNQFTKFPYKTDVVDIRFSHTFSIFGVRDERRKLVLNGHGFEPRCTHTVTELSLPSGDRIVDFSCSDTRILVLNDLGELFVLDLLERPINLREKRGLIIEKLDEIVRIANGMTLNVAVSRQGNVFSIPNLLEYEGNGVEDIACGNEHCVILDNTGNVYSFGCNSRGQLGLGHLDNEIQPVLIEALAGIKIDQISVGGWHSCAVSNSGDLYTWGWNRDGQLGTKRDDNTENVSILATPTLVEFPKDILVKRTSCGSRHTIVISDDDVIYGCGCNKFNQLGIESSDNSEMQFLYQIENEENSKLVDIKCGPASTALLFE